MVVDYVKVNVLKLEVKESKKNLFFRSQIFFEKMYVVNKDIVFFI